MLLSLEIQVQKLHELFLKVVCEMSDSGIGNISDLFLPDLKDGIIMSCSQPSRARDFVNNLLSQRMSAAHVVFELVDDVLLYGGCRPDNCCWRRRQRFIV